MAESASGIDTIAVSVIIGYMLGTTLIGSLMARRTSGASDWSVGGGSMGVLFVAVGIAGTRIGGAGTYGVAGDVIRTGLWNLWYGVNAFLALLIVGLFFARPYRRLGLHTVSEIFIRRFDSRRCQWLTSFCVQTEYLVINLIEPYIIAKILQGVIPDLEFIPAVIIGGAVIVTYTALGGLKGTAITNLIHCVVIIFGLLLVSLMGIRFLGGWEAVADKVNLALAQSDPPRDSNAWWSFTGAGWGAVIGMFFSAAIHTPGASVYVNYSTAIKNEKSILPAFLLAGAIAAPMSFLAGLIGLETLAHYGAASQLSSYRLITTLATEISPWVGGIALAAILAAVISSGGPILLASSTMFVRDWIPASRDWTADRQLRAYRMTTVLYGAFSVVVVCWVKTLPVLDLLLFGFAMVVPPAIAVGYLIYWKGTTEASAFWGIALGYAGGAVWFLAIKAAEHYGLSGDPGAGALTRLAHTCFGDGGIDPSYATTLIPLFVIPIVALRTRDTEAQAALADRFHETIRNAPQKAGA